MRWDGVTVGHGSRLVTLSAASPPGNEQRRESSSRPLSGDKHGNAYLGKCDLNLHCGPGSTAVVKIEKARNFLQAGPQGIRKGPAISSCSSVLDKSLHCWFSPDCRRKLFLTMPIRHPMEDCTFEASIFEASHEAFRFTKPLSLCSSHTLCTSAVHHSLHS